MIRLASPHPITGKQNSAPQSIAAVLRQFFASIPWNRHEAIKFSPARSVAAMSGCGWDSEVSQLSRNDKKCPIVSALKMQAFSQFRDVGTLGTPIPSRDACAGVCKRRHGRACGRVCVRAPAAVPSVPMSQYLKFFIYINILRLGRFSSAGTVGAVLALTMPALQALEWLNAIKILPENQRVRGVA